MLDHRSRYRSRSWRLAAAASVPLLYSFGAAWGEDQARSGEAGNPIQHVIIIMQENRSFDHYFGTFPGANGIPAGTCLPIVLDKPKCVAPFHDFADVNAGGPHTVTDAVEDFNGGKMNGFIPAQEAAGANVGADCIPPTNPLCAGNVAGIKSHDVAGYHTDAEIPNYWAYARNFVLQDAMFEPVFSYSLPSHMYLLSEWSARCKSSNPLSCTSEEKTAFGNNHTFPWTSLSYLLDQGNVSWKYYLGEGDQPDCSEGEMTCAPTVQLPTVQSIWNPLPNFTTVQAANQTDPTYLSQHVVSSDQFLLDVRNGTLPAVSWIVPGLDYSEHPSASVQTGMMYVSSLINAIMATGLPGATGTNYWQNTVIILAWDDWGGFYDHVLPPVVDTLADGTQLGYGFRVPSIIMSPYVKAGTIDHQTMSFDAYNTFIEDIFLAGRRLDPATDGRPDSRPDVREALTVAHDQAGNPVPIGDLMNDFDFTQAPLPPLMQPTSIPLDVVTQHVTSGVVEITWSAVTNDVVTGYNVSRATTPNGPYTVLPGCGGVGFLATSCIDKKAKGEAPYYYIVTSILPDGSESPNSAPSEFK